MRELKAFDSYKRRLKLFAKAIGVTIKYGDTDSEGVYIPSIRVIFIDPNLSTSMEIAIMLHELGHVVDDKLVDKTKERYVEKSYKAFYKGKYTKKQFKFVIDSEKRAWRYGRTIASRCRIRTGKWYTEAEKFCLNNYKST